MAVTGRNAAAIPAVSDVCLENGPVNASPGPHRAAHYLALADTAALAPLFASLDLLTSSGFTYSQLRMQLQGTQHLDGRHASGVTATLHVPVSIIHACIARAAQL